MRRYRPDMVCDGPGEAQQFAGDCRDDKRDRLAPGGKASIRAQGRTRAFHRGKKRHVLVDTQGLLMEAVVHAADIQDRDRGLMLMAMLFGLYPFLLKLYADAGYQGLKFQTGLARVC